MIVDSRTSIKDPKAMNEFITNIQGTLNPLPKVRKARHCSLKRLRCPWANLHNTYQWGGRIGGGGK